MLSVFVSIDSLVVSSSQDTGGYAISRHYNLELHFGCHTCWLTYFTLVCLLCGPTVDGRTVTWLPKFLGWVDYHIFLGMGLRSRVRSRPQLKKPTKCSFRPIQCSSSRLPNLSSVASFTFCTFLTSFMTYIPYYCDNMEEKEKAAMEVQGSRKVKFESKRLQKFILTFLANRLSKPVW